MFRVTIADSAEQMLDPYGIVMTFTFGTYEKVTEFVAECIHQDKVVMIEGDA